MIRLDHVTKRFGGIAAVNDVSFGISPGEIHAVVGENGAGKSTIMKMLAGVYQPDSGRSSCAANRWPSATPCRPGSSGSASSSRN